jgi:hypothetical protein
MIISDQWKKEIKWVCETHKCLRFYDAILKYFESLPFIEYHEVQPGTRRVLERMLHVERNGVELIHKTNIKNQNSAVTTVAHSISVSPKEGDN